MKTFLTKRLDRWLTSKPNETFWRKPITSGSLSYITRSRYYSAQLSFVELYLKGVVSLGQR